MNRSNNFEFTFISKKSQLREKTGKMFDDEHAPSYGWQKCKHQFM